MEVSGHLPDPLGQGPKNPQDSKVDGPQSQSGRYGEEKHLCPCRKSNPESSAVDPIAYSLYV
jgi:hypothetical protein